MGFSDELQTLLEKYGAFASKAEDESDQASSNLPEAVSTSEEASDTGKLETAGNSTSGASDTTTTESDPSTEGRLRDTIVEAIRDALHYKEAAPETNPVEEFLNRPDGPLARRRARNTRKDG